MSFHDHSPGSLFDLVTGDLLNAHQARATEPGLVGAISLPSLDADTAAAIVKSVLDLAAKQFGDAGAALVLDHKDAIRKLIGPAVLEMADKVIHGLQDLKIAKP